ncbi:hypothetical protein ACQVBX_05700 [Dyella sp. KULCS107]|uniref:hypothetical protein n=1 Tax=Dyella sp. KULCS107 TaxID=3422216 RepID=UPI003D6E4238
MHIISSPGGRLRKAGRTVIVTAALPAVLLLCAFMKPQLPETIYDGTHYSTLIETYQHAYEHAGMTNMKVVTEATGKAPDGTVSTVKTYTFACPAVPGSHSDPCSATFSISASVKDDICRDCRITRTSYSGDPAVDEKATTEIRRVLGKSVPSAFGK